MKWLRQLWANRTVVALHDGDGSERHPFEQKMAQGPMDTVWSHLLYARQQVAPMLQSMFPGYGACYRCRFPWAVVSAHTTNYTYGRGCFPLCEDCWRELNPEERLPYYEQLCRSWGEGHADWNEMREAVLSESSERHYIRPIPSKGAGK